MYVLGRYDAHNNLRFISRITDELATAIRAYRDNASETDRPADDDEIISTRILGFVRLMNVNHGDAGKESSPPKMG